jgi:hypothetical protein
LSQLYPRMVGISPQGPKSGDDRWHELLVAGEDEVGALAKLANVLALNGVNLAPSGGYYSVSPGAFVWTTFANFTRTRSTLEHVIKDLKRLEFVRRVEAVSMTGVAVDQFLFPVMITEKVRGLIMSLEPLLGVERRLLETFGSAGASLMFEMGRQYTIESLRQLREVLPGSAPEEFLALVVSWLRTTGWGIFEFDAPRLEKEGAVIVNIGEPPNAVVSGLPRSNFLNGATAGIIESVFGSVVRLTDSAYDEPGKSLRLTFEVARPASGVQSGS